MHAPSYKALRRHLDRLERADRRLEHRIGARLPALDARVRRLEAEVREALTSARQLSKIAVAVVVLALLVALANLAYAAGLGLLAAMIAGNGLGMRRAGRRQTKALAEARAARAAVAEEQAAVARRAAARRARMEAQLATRTR